ncbi:hypothetical protein KCU78_g6088, partial [Aureobasidium melanogenum]
MVFESQSEEELSTFADRSFAIDDAMQSPRNDSNREAHQSLLSASSATRAGPADVEQPKAAQEINTEVKSSSPSPERRSPRKNIYTWVCDEWLFEILACALALLALAAIVITLAVHDGRPLPEWPFNISVNALVSIFGVILKTSMMLPVSESISQLKWAWFQKPHSLSHFTEFDSASRGPWGCLKVLRRCHVRHLTSIGAAITLLALASDPFIQQMIKYKSVAFELTGNDVQAFVSRSNNYTLHGAHTGAGYESLNLSAQAAIYKGVYNSYSSVEATCSSGNCTFKDYRTLGMCSHCQDISSTINKTCTKSSLCSFELPQGPSVKIPGSAILNMSTVVSAGYNHYSTNVSGLSTTNLVGRIGAMSDELMGIQCTLYPCIRTYTANVTKGNISETLLSVSQVFADDHSEFAGFHTTPMPCLINGTYHNASEFVTPNLTNTIAINGLLPTNQTAYMPSDCVFAYADPLGMAEYLGTFLSGSVTMYGTSSPDWLGQLVAMNTTAYAYPTFDLINTA